MDCATTIASALHLKGSQVQQTLRLLEEGCTIPFIARYRKEATDSLDEVQVTAIRDLWQNQQQLSRQRQTILRTLAKNDQLSPELQKALTEATSLAQLDDIYLPFRPKRRTRAAMAREAGYEPLAELLYRRQPHQMSPTQFLDTLEPRPELEQALAGARDIIAERVNEHQESRERLRALFRAKAIVSSSVIEKKRDQAHKYRDYFAWQEPVGRMAGHRLLAMLRGENEQLLHLALRPEAESALAILYRLHITAKTGDARQVRAAIEDGYGRLLAPSLENELRNELREGAEREAIEVFCRNIRELLLAPPLGRRRVMALDPGFRTGAKLVCLSEQGQLLASTTIYPTQSARQRLQAAETVGELIGCHRIEAIAIGSGTAGRETEQFIRELALPEGMVITLVNEDGASVYSASETARREFPELDLTVRGAISIGRRLQDPLAELVKIDPKAIGVGQYQHDVNQTALKSALADVVASCVNSVGVELNSASLELLTHVSGIGPTLAANIVDHRQHHGPFASRKDLLAVDRLGPKAFEQCAGFLRVDDSANPLDRSAVHPERYPLVTRMARDLGVAVSELIRSDTLAERIDLTDYLDADIGLPTLQDILAELARPGRDPRADFTNFAFAETVRGIEDLQPGMKLPAIITNVTTFGAFADIGVHQDGLIHISQLADRFVADPATVVRPRQQVMVRVLEVDLARKRIALSLKKER
ncbi:MAG: Tex family protein [Desulfopila sp.]